MSITQKFKKPSIYPLIGLGCFFFSSASQAQTEDKSLIQTIEIQAGKLSQSQFDTPASINVLNSNVISGAGPQVNLTETLNQVPGVMAMNRNNYAQDLQISVRGFGARAAFGLRGIRLITDGIPATTPDGQGQASSVSLTSADHIEVLTGPLAQIYGNASGGVIQSFTREAGAKPVWSSQIYLGSYGLLRKDIQLSQKSGNMGIVSDLSTFSTQGFRENSDAQRQQLNTVVTSQLQQDTKLKFIFNSFDMPLARDPLGLTSAQFANATNSAGNNALLDGTRKTVNQLQYGWVAEHRIDPRTTLQAKMYSGTRDNLQYQASSSTVPSTAINSTWVGLGRHFSGLGLQAKSAQNIGDDVLIDWIVGTEFDRSNELRQNGPTRAGVITPGLTRNELNQSSNQDFFTQTNLHWGNDWSLTAGARYSELTLANADYFLSDGDGSGQVKYKALSPILGITWHFNDALNIYLQQGSGFETPALSELAYSLVAGNVKGNFNPNLLASHSKHLEVGSKWKLGSHQTINASVFQIKSDDEIIALLSKAGQTVYGNAGKTIREGLELTHHLDWNEQLTSKFALSTMRANYVNAFSSINSAGQNILIQSGNQLPGIAQHQMYASLIWKDQAQKLSKNKSDTQVQIDLLARSGLWANDSNADYASGYGILNLKLRHNFKVQEFENMFYFGVDNLTNKKTIGSVIINQANNQFFESGMYRNYTMGIQIKHPM
jgi:iron complex outermembrane recepter protein